ncbi:hypothetical protein DAI22_07g104800 [Oryza sativa Japonica Group]|nr:hypothetical protein DAI22_07g104800 [Oryza sativa Japonica Group]
MVRKEALKTCIVATAIICFNDRYIYSGIQGQYRLGPEGALRVPSTAAEAFCGGPCLAETERRTWSSATSTPSWTASAFTMAPPSVMSASRLAAAAAARGDFDVLQRLGDDDHGCLICG